MISAVLLAAGESTRMGSPKPLLPWGDATLIDYELAQLKASKVEKVVVVLGHEAETVRRRIRDPDVLVVTNADYRQGRASSVRAGVQALLPDTEAVLILAVDQPRPADLIDRLVAAHQQGGTLITVPSYQGRRGHPPIFDGTLMPELAAVRDELFGLREVMSRHAGKVQEVPYNSPVVLLDINSPEEYETARKTIFGR
jgi:molybdenum cofactor cytidylyltransferase